MNERESIKIFVCTHKATKCVENGILTPIHIGASMSKNKLGNMLRDDWGDNRSERDIEYGELTAQYWAWKNMESDYYGFFHYRRYLNFTKNVYPEDGWGNVVDESISKSTVGKFGLDEETIKRTISGFDIVRSHKLDIYKMPCKKMSVEKQYWDSEYMKCCEDDIQLTLDIINDKYPAYYQYAYRFFYGHEMSYCNMFIMKRDLYFSYCEWLFSILDEFEAIRNTENYNLYASRTPGLLAERLFNVFCLYQEGINSKIKIKDLQSVYFKDTEPEEEFKPAFHAESALVITSSGDYYAPFLGVWLQSIIDNANPERNYDILILEDGISLGNKELLQRMVRFIPNFSLRFYAVGDRLKEFSQNNWNHTTRLTYARFLIPEICKTEKKALWLDTDIVVTKDVFELFSVDVSDYFLAAVRDVRASGQLNYPGDPQKSNFTKILKLENPYMYFQAGVMLLNLEEFRQHFPTDFLLKESERTDLRWLDQDIMNMYCQGRVKYLPQNWNLLVRAHIPIESYAPSALKKEYDNARKDPWIVHYAGKLLPVYAPNGDMVDYFWKYARNSPFYEILIHRMMTETLSFSASDNQPNVYISWARKWADKWLPKGSLRRNIAKKMLPKGSRRWEFFRGIYNRLIGIK